VSSGGRVYACSGAAFDGSVTIPAGVTIYGGLVCTTWMYDGQNPTNIQVAGDATPLTLESGGGVTLLADLHVQAAAAVKRGGSSIGLIADGATGVLNRVRITTGDGKAGAGGSTPRHGNTGCARQPGRRGVHGAHDCGRCDELAHVRRRHHDGRQSGTQKRSWVTLTTPQAAATPRA
jgi:hypothetical protein